MKKLMIAAAVAMAIAAGYAADAGLQAAANDPAVAQMAEEDPDGCQIFFDEDGSMKVISTGTGVYDFNDQDEIEDARKEATRNAKAHIVKFFKENFSTAEQAENATKKAKSLKSDGENETVSISKETVKKTVETVKSDASKVLSGIVVLKDEKIPSGKKGGVVRVTVGVSSTTLLAAEKVSNAMTDSVNRQNAHRTGAGAPARGGAASGAPNEGKVRRSRGAF